MFKDFKLKVEKKFQELVDNNDVLFLTDVEKDTIWDKYLSSFPNGTNNIFVERGEYECNTCKQFLRPYGNVVAINKDGELTSIWDIEVDGYYQEVANELSKLVKSKQVRDKFISKFAKLGTSTNVQLLDDGTTRTWNHFSFELPKSFVDKSSDSEESIMGTFRSHKDVFKRSLDEINIEGIETTLELIEQGSVYRGEEYKNMVSKFLEYKKIYNSLDENKRDNYCWLEVDKAGAVSKIRNTTIGTLLTDISEGTKSIDASVFAFENKMDPTKFKRPRTVVTARQIENAEKSIVDLGLEESLGRRYAKMEDITVNNVIFANRDAKKAMSSSVFDEMKDEVKVHAKNFDKVEEIGIEDFIKTVVPKATSISAIVENKHINNLMSLIAPLAPKAKTMLKWNNNFTWAYNGDVTDSMKEKVKRAGGKVDGVLRFSIDWTDRSNNDLDAHCIEPKGNLIYYNSKNNYNTGGNLDVDIIEPINYKDVVENITWPTKSKMEEGRYQMIVHNYSKRGTKNGGFSAEIEFEGEVHSFEYSDSLRQGEKVLVAELEYSKATGIKIIKSLDSTTTSKEVWNISTNKFQKVSTLMFSPNYWDDQKGIGNKHYFFMLENCENDGTPRGFFNEFLNQDLMEHKRVFEILGNKMKVKESPNQLSGIGFSSTKRDSMIVQVEGTFKRTLKINF